MGAVESGTAHVGMGRQRLLRSRQAHRVVMVLLNRRQTRGAVLGSTAHLALFCLTAFGSSHYLIGASLVRRVVEQSANVVDEEGIEQFGDLLLVCKVQSSLKRDPVIFPLVRPSQAGFVLSWGT